MTLRDFEEMAWEPDPEDVASGLTGRNVLVERHNDQTVLRIENKGPARTGIGVVTLLLLVAALLAGIGLSETHSHSTVNTNYLVAAGLVIFACYGTWRTYKVIRWPARVVVERTGLTAYNLQNVPAVHANASGISSIQILDRQLGQGRRHTTMRVPRVIMRDGSEDFWLEGLGIVLPTVPAAKEAQEQGVRQIRALLKRPDQS